MTAENTTHEYEPATDYRPMTTDPRCAVCGHRANHYLHEGNR